MPSCLDLVEHDFARLTSEPRPLSLDGEQLGVSRYRLGLELAAAERDLVQYLGAA